MSDEDWLRDQHARYHDQPGNLFGRDECGESRCDFWDAAQWVLAARPLAHVALKTQLADSFEAGRPSVALCGHEWVPTELEPDWPVCFVCVHALLNELADAKAKLEASQLRRVAVADTLWSHIAELHVDVHEAQKAAEQAEATAQQLIAKIEAEIHHAEDNDHRLSADSQGVAFGEIIPAVRIDHLRAALRSGAR